MSEITEEQFEGNDAITFPIPRWMNNCVVFDFDIASTTLDQDNL